MCVCVCSLHRALFTSCLVVMAVWCRLIAVWAVAWISGNAARSVSLHLGRALVHYVKTPPPSRVFILVWTLQSCNVPTNSMYINRSHFTCQKRKEERERDGLLRIHSSADVSFQEKQLCRPSNIECFLVWALLLVIILSWPGMVDVW